MPFVASESSGRPAHAAGAPLRRDERLWLLGLVIVTLCSWGRWLATGSLKVDESYPSEFWGTLLLAVLAGGYVVMVVGWRGSSSGAWEPATLGLHRPRRGISDAAHLSNDVFSLFGYGSTGCGRS